MSPAEWEKELFPDNPPYRQALNWSRNFNRTRSIWCIFCEGHAGPVRDYIIHLNDDHKLSFWEIALMLEELDPQLITIGREVN